MSTNETEQNVSVYKNMTNEIVAHFWWPGSEMK